MEPLSSFSNSWLLKLKEIFFVDNKVQVLEQHTGVVVPSVVGIMNRVLNNSHGSAIASLKGDGTFDFTSGKYKLDLMALAHRTNNSKVYLYNVTDDIYVKTVVPDFYQENTAGSSVLPIRDTVFIDVPSLKKYQLRQYTQIAVSNGGSGSADNLPSDISAALDWVCAQVIIRKIGD